MKRKYIAVLFTVLSVALGSVQTALADAAPPEVPPGASVGSGEPSTYVQMVSESVLMEIADLNGPPDRLGLGIVSNIMIGRVQATFNMVNQGTEAETLAVRFPLSSLDGHSGGKTVENFVATVDGQVTQTQIVEQQVEWGDPVPWATWQANFPPGQTVVLGVEYDVHPEGYTPWGAFTYILETGAGWYGPIGEGTIVYRLPYQVTDLNTTRGNAWNPEEQYYILTPYTFSGTDIVWRFTNLEPTSSDNIHFTVLPPAVWARIEQAQAAQANSNAAETQLELGNSLFDALSFTNVGLTEIGGSVTFAEQAREAYRRAWELAPDNIDVCTGYLGFMLAMWQPSVPSTKSEDILVVLERAQELAPNDPRVLELQQSYQYLQQDEIYFQELPASLTAVAVASPTPAPEVTLTAAPLAIVTPSPVPVVVPASSSGTATRPSVWILAVPLIAIGATVTTGGVLVVAWVAMRGKSSRR